MAEPSPHHLPDEPDEAPGVPGFQSWRGIYVFVFAGFVVLVIALSVFSYIYA